MKKLAITIIATAAISAANTDAQTTQRLTADRTNEYGLIYTLPSTVIDITMRIERTVKRPGEFNKYAKKYLNIAKPITKTEEYVTVTDAVINCHGEADAEKKYIIQFATINQYRRDHRHLIYGTARSAGHDGEPIGDPCRTPGRNTGNDTKLFKRQARRTCCSTHL